LAESQKEMLLPRARALYAEGSTYDVIAESLGVSARTVRRWAAQDRAAGAVRKHCAPAFGNASTTWSRRAS